MKPTLLPGNLELQLDAVDGPVIARAEVPQWNEWTAVKPHLSVPHSGLHNPVVLRTNDGELEIDWVNFE